MSLKSSVFNNRGNELKLVKKIDTKTSRGMLSKGEYQDEYGSKYLIKGNSDYGWEPQSEVLVSIILRILDISHVPYWLEPASNYPSIKMSGNDFVSICPSYLNRNIKQSIPYYKYINTVSQIRGDGDIEDMWEYLLTLPNNIINRTILILYIDALVGNEDRHLSNWNININIDGTHEVSEMFDFGASLLSWHSDITKINFDRAEYDRARPFRTTHKKQIQLIERDIGVPFIKFNVDEVMKRFINEGKYVLGTMSDNRQKVIVSYLRHRLEVYG